MPASRATNLSALLLGFAAAPLAAACGSCNHAAPLAAAENHHTRHIACTEHQCLEYDAQTLGKTLFAYPVFDGLVPRHEVEQRFVGRSATPPPLNSRPGTNDVIYLDFDGYLDNGAWSDVAGFQLDRPPFDLDGDPSTFNADEQNRIFEVWQRVSEDYAIFDVNVTTVEPPLNQLGNGNGIRVVFDPSNSWFGPAGGVAFLNSYYSSPNNAVCWVFIDGTGGGWPKGMAEAASHEVGHTFGLLHQSYYVNGNFVREYSRGDEEDGYLGPDAWAPIMGVGYNLPVVTFHNGPTNQGANALQFDLSFADDAFTRLPDEYGSSTGSGLQLAFDQNGRAVVDGAIQFNGDEDAFVFQILGQGTLNATVEPFRPGPNLDAELQLFGPSGLIEQAQPAGTIDATITRNDLDAGTYILRVTDRNIYGRIGSYTVTIDVTDTGPTCDADTNSDNAIDGADLLAVINNFGAVNADAASGDVTGDSNVDGADLLSVINSFGQTCQ